MVFSQYFDTPQIHGVGIDIVEVNRFQFIRTKSNSQLLRNLFTNKEIKECRKKQNPAASFAARFAAKEAIKKSICETVPFSKLEIMNTPDGQPKAIALSKRLQKQYCFLISMTHTREMASAICLAFKR